MGNNGSSGSSSKGNSSNFSKDVGHCMVKHTANLDGSRGAYGDLKAVGCIVDRTIDRALSNHSGVSSGDGYSRNGYPSNDRSNDRSNGRSHGNTVYHKLGVKSNEIDIERLKRRVTFHIKNVDLNTPLEIPSDIVEKWGSAGFTIDETRKYHLLKIPLNTAIHYKITHKVTPEDIQNGKQINHDYDIDAWKRCGFTLEEINIGMALNFVIHDCLNIKSFKLEIPYLNDIDIDIAENRKHVEFIKKHGGMTRDGSIYRDGKMVSFVASDGSRHRVRRNADKCR